MTTVANASVVFKDKNGNVGTVKGASANDITKISNAISDVAQVVDPTSHLPIQATTSSVGVVQLADSAAVSAGTSGRVVDAAQLKDAIEHVTPAGNLMTLDTAQTVTAVKTFSSLPESSVVPTTNNQLVNKKYVDDHTPTGVVDLTSVQTISGLKDFSVLPTTSVPPTNDAHLVNKWYVDTTKVSLNADQTVAGTKTFSSSPLMPTATAGDSSAKGASTAFVQNAIAQLVPTGTILAFGGVTIPSGWLLCNGAGVSRSTFSNLFAKIGTIYGAGDGSTTFNLPDFRDRYPIGSGTNLTGTKVAEQLPNITGWTQVWTNPGRNWGGAVTLIPNTGYVRGETSGSTMQYAGFDVNASLSNSIYTDNGKVYPASIALNFIIKT